MVAKKELDVSLTFSATHSYLDKGDFQFILCSRNFHLIRISNFMRNGEYL